MRSDSDLPPLHVLREWEERVRALMPEMPDVKAERYVREMKLSEDAAQVLTESREMAEYFEACVAAGAVPVRASNWVRTEVLRVLNDRQIPLSELSVRPETLAGLLGRVKEERLSTSLDRKSVV